MPMSDNMRGALLMVGAMTAFTVNDAFMKAVARELPVMQATFWRGVIVLPLMVLLCHTLGQLRFAYTLRDWGLLIVRALGEMLGAVFFLTALFNMPFANVSAILQALPLTVSLGAAVFFSEPLGWRRLTAILVGFAGVLLIVQPGGADFSVYSLYAVGCVCAATLRDLAARRMSTQVPSSFAGLVAAFGVLIMSGVGTFFEQSAPLTTSSLIGLTCASIFIVAAYVFSAAAMRVGEIGFVAPFRYTSLLVAMLLGAVAFGEIPSGVTLLGAAIVVSMGLFTLYRERIAVRRQSSNK
ncbi:MAG: DMT family transporter [Pseudomonadota bacterium]